MGWNQSVMSHFLGGWLYYCYYCCPSPNPVLVVHNKKLCNFIFRVLRQHIHSRHLQGIWTRSCWPGTSTEYLFTASAAIAERTLLKTTYQGIELDSRFLDARQSHMDRSGFQSQPRNTAGPESRKGRTLT